jgi:hypothetical protein
MTEMIRKYKDNIISAMCEAYESSIRSEGNIQYSLYLMPNGEVVAHEEIAGDTFFYQDDGKMFLTTITGRIDFDDTDEYYSREDQIEEEMYEYSSDQVYTEFDDLLSREAAYEDYIETWA